MIRRRLDSLVILCAAVASCAYAAGAQGVSDPGQDPPAPSPLACADRPLAFERPCVIPQALLLVETGYYQNASKVGGTALAAYPLTLVRVGVAPRVEASLTAPVQYAQSSRNGKGAYPRNPAGFGAKWLVFRSPYASYALSAQFAPALDRNAPAATHTRYNLTGATGLVVDDRTSVDLSLGTATYGRRYRRERNGVREGVALHRALTAAMSVSGEVTLRSSASSGSAQTAAAVYLQQAVLRNALVDVGLGTAFNATGNAKAHYLSFGFAVRP